MRLPIFAHYTYMLFKQIDHFFVRAQFSSTALTEINDFQSY